MATEWDNAGAYGRWGEPPFIVVFGGYGIGKSVDATLFAPTGYTLGPPGGIRGAAPILGPELYAQAQQRTAQVSSLDQITATLVTMAEGRLPRYPVRIDDLTLVAQADLTDLQRQFPSPRDTGTLYGVFKRRLINMRDAMRRAGVPVVANCHVATPATDVNGKFTPGGPSMAAPSALPLLVASADTIYGMERDEDRYPWPACYRHESPNAQWAYKDRHGAFNGRAPANLREIMRSTGMTLPLPAELAWTDDYAEGVAEAAAPLAGEDLIRLFQLHLDHLIAQKVFKGHAYIAVRNGLDRAALRKQGSHLDAVLSGALRRTGLATLAPLANGAPAAGASASALPSLSTPGALPPLKP
jgi:hypothetical protein